MNDAYIALGSNIHPRQAYLKKAIDQLEKDKVEVVKTSDIYETEPVGYTEQDPFLNMVVKVKTSLEPIELLHRCQEVEKELGRKREIRWGPRTIDLDILLYNQENINLEQLMIPHPRMHERAFVLVPLHDIDPVVNIPSVNKNVATILDELSEREKKGVVKWTQLHGEKRIKAFRKLKGLTQMQFARKLGISVSILGEIERGNRIPNERLLYKITDVLDITIEELSPQTKYEDG